MWTSTPHPVGPELDLVVLDGNTLVAVDPQHLPADENPNVQRIAEFTTNVPVHAGERLGIGVPATPCDCEVMQIDGVHTSDFWVPSLTLNQTGLPKYTAQAPTPILNADIGAPSPPSGGNAPPAGETKVEGHVIFSNGGPNINLATDTKNGFFTSPAKCELPPGSPEKCTGAVVFVGFRPSGTNGVARLSSRKKKAPLYGRVKFSLNAGQSKKIKVPLKKAAKAGLEKKGKLIGNLTTTSTLTSGASASLTQKLKLKLKPKSKPKASH